jgi:hypothetical protein
LAERDRGHGLLHFTVAATDAHGHQQLEPLAGGLTVAK